MSSRRHLHLLALLHLLPVLLQRSWRVQSVAPPKWALTLRARPEQV